MGSIFYRYKMFPFKILGIVFIKYMYDRPHKKCTVERCSKSGKN